VLGELKQSTSKGKKDCFLMPQASCLPTCLLLATCLVIPHPTQFLFELAAYEVNWLKVELVLAPII
jgi:hypothetical protein